MASDQAEDNNQSASEGGYIGWDDHCSWQSGLYLSRITTMMRCVLLLALVAVACCQQSYRYSDRVDNSRSVFTQHRVLQPSVVHRPSVAPRPVQQPLVFVPQAISDTFIGSQKFMHTSFQEPPQQSFNRPQTSRLEPQVYILPEPQEQETSEVIMLPEMEPRRFAFQPAQPDSFISQEVFTTQNNLNKPQFLDVNLGSHEHLACNLNGIVDFLRDGEAYHFSWCHDWGRTYSFQQAQDYCAILGHGFRAVSVETPGKHFHLASAMQAHYVDYIWTSGNRLDYLGWSWSNGASSSYTNWAPTGSLGMPQPDNASGDEQCLAVHLNQLTGRAAWQDYSCSFRFPVVCQIPAYN